MAAAKPEVVVTYVVL